MFTPTTTTTTATTATTTVSYTHLDVYKRQLLLYDNKSQLVVMYAG